MQETFLCVATSAQVIETKVADSGGDRCQIVELVCEVKNSRNEDLARHRDKCSCFLLTAHAQDWGACECQNGHCAHPFVENLKF